MAERQCRPVHIYKCRILLLASALLVLLAIHQWRHGGACSKELVTGPRFQEWPRLFEFVPNGLYNCTDLFPNHKLSNSMGEFFPEVYLYHAKSHEELLANFGGTKEGYSAKYVEQLMVYWKIAQAPFVETVCETGFNGGHSALLWLSANPHLHVYSFDIGEHEYAHPMAEYLHQRFPGRLTLTWGDSNITLPQFHANHPDIICDIAVIDGGHTYDIATADLRNFQRMAGKNSIVVLDDYPATMVNFMETLGPVWETHKQNGDIIEILSCSYRFNNATTKEHGFSLGRYNIH